MEHLLAVAARELKYPIEGEFAYKLWELCSSDRLPALKAKRLYLACGYEPFCGYPLTIRREVAAVLNW